MDKNNEIETGRVKEGEQLRKEQRESKRERVREGERDR